MQNTDLSALQARRDFFKAKAKVVAAALHAEVSLDVGDDGPEDGIRANFRRGSVRVLSFFSPVINMVWFERTFYGRGRGSRYTKVERLQENVSKRLELAELRAKSQAAYDARRKVEREAQDVVDGWMKIVAPDCLDTRGATGTATIHPVISSSGELSFRVDLRYRKDNFKMEAQVPFLFTEVYNFFTLAVESDTKING